MTAPPPRRVVREEESAAMAEEDVEVEGRMGCIRRVAPVRRREAYVECRAWGAVGRGLWVARWMDGGGGCAAGAGADGGAWVCAVVDGAW